MSCNKREQGIFVKERLDRGLASPEWCSLFPNAGIEVKPPFVLIIFPFGSGLIIAIELHINFFVMKLVGMLPMTVRS
jgi:hypothetical protein